MTFASPGTTHKYKDKNDAVTTSMKAPMAAIIRNRLLRVFFALLTTFFTGSLVWADSAAQHQDCASHCEQIAQSQSHEPFGVFPQMKPTSANPVTVNPIEQVDALQPLEPAAGADVRAAGPRVTPSSADASEGGSAPGPNSFLIIGSVLISARLIISYRSRKPRKLAAETR
jgi:hypothetical protein